ncbi:MAG: RsmB/NOP family class I SAM-dependent RNA methyltransferase [Roseinatronobacter sp.]
MTPAARHQAAIEILDQIMGGANAEMVLTRWARASRFAGSKDRAAVRDLVFDALRCRRSFAHLGGAETGRGVILGGLRAADTDPYTIFTGTGYAPDSLSRAEASYHAPDMPEAVALDCPDWLLPQLRESLGTDLREIMQALRHRAPVMLRVNSARISRADAQEDLRAQGIETRPHDLASTALEVISNPRAIQTSEAFRTGLVELQDAASQAVIEALPSVQNARVLDFCAGGGGKSLALAALGARVTAHDAAPARMRDLPERAARAGATIRLAEQPSGQFDLVLADVPCSGSGSWRRSPDGKWNLTPDRLAELVQTQAQILRIAARHVAPSGYLAYVTCSLLHSENHGQISAFLQSTSEFRLVTERRFTPLHGGDGFYLAVLATGGTVAHHN